MRYIAIFLMIAMCFGLFAREQINEYELSPNLNNDIFKASTSTDEMWDILGTFLCSDGGNHGIGTDGTNFYSSKSNEDIFSRYDMDGTLMGMFTIPSVVNIRDLAYDSTYFYGSAASMTINILDLANESLIGNIPVNCSGITGVRHISFDPELDDGNGGFWIGNWDELGAVAMDGSEIFANILGVAESTYGSAYDPYTAGGPYLWFFGQTGPNDIEIRQVDIATQSLTGVTHDASDLPGYTSAYAGGLTSYENDSGQFVLVVDLQQSPNLIGLYELVITVDPQAPGAATNVTAIPDAGGALEVQIDWTCPDIDADGNPLTELSEMKVYREDELIYTDSNPTIGGSGNFLDDTIPLSGFYTYKIIGSNSFGEGLSVTVNIFTGEDVPSVVDDLEVEQTSPGVLSATISWENPTTGLNGGSLNNPILGYHIIRYSDEVLIEITEYTTSYVDDDIPYSGIYSYSIQPYNQVGDGGIEQSDNVLIADSGLMFLEEFITWLPTDWSTTSTSGQINWIHGISMSAGGEPPEAIFSWEPGTIATQRLISPMIDTSEASEIYLQYKQYIDDYGGGYSLSVQTTSDGSTWNDVLSFPAVNSGPEVIDVEITTPDVGSSTFQVAWVFDGDSYNINFWHVDDAVLAITGTTSYPPVNLAVNALTGYFTWEAPATGDIAYYNVYLDGELQGDVSNLEWQFENLLNGTTYEAGVAAVFNNGGMTTMTTLEFTYEGTDAGDVLPLVTELKGNYPNPFNPETTINYQLPENSNVELSVYNLKGQKVKQLVSDQLSAGQHSVIWNGTDNNGKTVSSGIYFYKLKTNEFSSTKKMILLK